MIGIPKLNRNRAGQVNTNAKGFSESEDAPEITILIRQAAAKGMERPTPSDGNVESVEEAPPAGPSKKTKPPKPAKASDKGNDAAAERTPPYAKESLAGDGWTRAREAARKMHRSK